MDEKKIRLREKDMLKISIIVPVYNIERYLAECIESLIHQTYENIEVILVDDGSRDTSGRICDEYAIKDFRVKVFHIENSGPSVARNYGLKKATGDYVMFVDSDDWIEEKTLEICCKMVKKYKCEVVLFNMCDYDDKHMREYRIMKAKERNFEGKEMEYLEDMLLTLQGENPVSVTSLTGPVCKLYKKEIATRCTFPKDITLGEDTCFVEQILEKADSLVYVNQILYHRRILKNSLSHNYGLDYIQRRAQYVNWTLEFYKNKKRDDLLNTFCFVNYCAVFFKLAEIGQISIKEKNALMRNFLNSVNFKENMENVDIKCGIRKIEIFRYLLKKQHLTLAFYILHIANVLRRRK